ncbi:MAG: RNA polymerase sigma factor RpoH [Alphaproteobacteria bacterium]
MSMVKYTQPVYDLSSYLQKVKSFPMLSFEEEQELAKNLIEKQDKKAAEKLVSTHLRLVVNIAMGFRGYGLPIAELISEGNVGLVQAVNRFDPSKGYRLATYAMWWIKANIQEYVLHSWSLVKIGTTVAQKKLFFNLRKLKSRLEISEDTELSSNFVSAIAEELGVPEKDVISMNERLSGPDYSLNAEISHDGTSSWQDWLVDDNQNHEDDYADHQEFLARVGLLKDALRRLNKRERDIFIQRRLKTSATTLDSLSKTYGVSRERIRQVEMQAFQKVKKYAQEKATYEYTL